MKKSQHVTKEVSGQGLLGAPATKNYDFPSSLARLAAPLDHSPRPYLLFSLQTLGHKQNIRGHT